MPAATAGALGGCRCSHLIGHGRCYGEVHAKRNPSLEAADLSLRFGWMGLGSLEETRDFRGVRITGEERK